MPDGVPRVDQALLKDAQVLCHRDQFLDLLGKRIRFCEVGVSIGDFSEKVIRTCNPQHFVGIDVFDGHQRPKFKGIPAADYFKGKTHQQWYEDRLRAISDDTKVDVYSGNSFEKLDALPDESFDVVYIDADHRYPFVSKDLAAAKSKVAPGGYLVVNDYIAYDYVAKMTYGVVQATNEFMQLQRWPMAYFALNEKMFCDVVLKRPSLDEPKQLPKSSFFLNPKKISTFLTSNLSSKKISSFLSTKSASSH